MFSSRGELRHFSSSTDNASIWVARSVRRSCEPCELQTQCSAEKIQPLRARINQRRSDSKGRLPIVPCAKGGQELPGTMADMKDTKQRNQSSDEAAAQSSLKRIMSPSAEPTRAIVQGHTIELPPTSTHPGNKERSSLSPIDISRAQTSKHERRRLIRGLRPHSVRARSSS